MASGFFALLDDIAILMDDVAAMSKIATQKTAGLLADDLAVNAEKASGFVSSRELPILWRISKGSILNKIIILPLTFLLSAFFPKAIVPILIIGGIYLAFEGAEKIYEYLFHRNRNKTKRNTSKLEMTEKELLEHENKKIKSAIIVDFILSIEIIFITLGTVINEKLSIQIAVVTLIAILATIGVYGIVALIVRMDDLGYRLIASSNNQASISKSIGTGLVKSLPYVIRSLAFIGTIAMILVAGGIFVHNIHFIHELLHGLPKILGEFIAGLAVGVLSLFFIKPLLGLIKN